MPNSSRAADASEPGGHDKADVRAVTTQTDGELNGPAHRVNAKDIPARLFGALVGRDLRSLSGWDKEGITHPEIRRSRRYYGADDIEAVLRLQGRKGPRAGSLIKYLATDWDSDT